MVLNGFDRTDPANALSEALIKARTANRVRLVLGRHAPAAHLDGDEYVPDLPDRS